MRLTSTVSVCFVLLCAPAFAEVPKPTGDTIAEVIRKEQPSIRIVMMTGFSEEDPQWETAKRCADVVLTKPITAQVLQTVLAGMIR